MPNLSQSGQQLVESIANRYGLSTDAVTHMLIAVYNGNGTMAQFNHPEFCGSGQWMRGGMTMVSDLFNNNLKCLVDNLCNDLSNELANHQTTPFAGSFQSQSQGGMSSQAQASGQLGSANSLFVPDPTSHWWPPELGAPTSVGSQNSLRYAYFADTHRLAVSTGGTPWVYDTLDHQIGGFAQQQGGGQSITFTSQYGTVDLSTLPVVSRDGHIPTQPQSSISIEPSAPATYVEPAGNAPSTSPQIGENVIDTLERLGSLREKGYITDEEFNSKKSELLARL